MVVSFFFFSRSLLSFIPLCSSQFQPLCVHERWCLDDVNERKKNCRINGKRLNNNTKKTKRTEWWSSKSKITMVLVRFFFFFFCRFSFRHMYNKHGYVVIKRRGTGEFASPIYGYWSIFFSGILYRLFLEFSFCSSSAFVKWYESSFGYFSFSLSLTTSLFPSSYVCVCAEW